MYPFLLWRAVRQCYRHSVQQFIVQQEMRSLCPFARRRTGWETGGIFALFSAAVLCGTLAQIHLG